ncbi:hypothetical protein G6F57_010780 [Rhizopus arrhizus]|nr:hypothetical protein G6F57_010780 [Rhizopus arrhizus]
MPAAVGQCPRRGRSGLQVEGRQWRAPVLGAPARGKKFEPREQARSPQATAGTETPAAPVPEQCSTARANLALLEGSGQVMQDTNGDGKPDTALTPEQRTAQKGLADAAIKAYCPTQ